MQALAFLLAFRLSAAEPPTVTVGGASQVTATSATITGTVNPNGLPTASHASYGPTTAYGYNGTYTPLTATNIPVPVTSTLPFLDPNTTYHYKLVATNSAGETASADMTFTTAAAAGPTATVDGALFITSSNATITGTVNPNGLPTGYFAQWGTTTAYGQAGPVGSLPPPSTNQPVSAAMLGLSPSTTYHYRLAATNSAGTGYSGDMTLTTAAAPPPPPDQPPTVVTGPATGITGSSANVEGTVNPNGLSTTYYFQWGASTAYGNALASVSVSPQTTTLYAYGTLTGLTPGTTYHYQLVAINSAGSTSGVDRTFTTLSAVSVDDNSFAYATNDDGTITIVGYTGPGGAISIPGTVTGRTVTRIGADAFSLVTNLTAVTIPDGVTTIANNAFARDAALTNVAIPNSVTWIGVGAFMECASLASVTIPGSVTNIADAAFTGCSSLASLSIGNGVASLGGSGLGMFGTFFGCTSLTSVTIPDSLTRIEDGPLSKGGAVGVFGSCSSLTNVIFGKGLTYLGVGTFFYCPNLLNVYFSGNAPTPGHDMFGEDIFHFADSATLYYLPGTTGWGNTYAGRPTVLWNAQLQTADGSAGMLDSRFGFNIAGTAGIPIVVEASSDPGEGIWVPLQTCTLTNGLLHFSDSDPTNYPARFYRIRWP